jgi:uncharacterized protein YraI
MASVVATVNLRSGPSTQSDVIATIPGGSKVQLKGCSGEWCAVTWDGHDGYAIGRNISTGAPRRYPAQAYQSGPPVVYGPPVYYGAPVAYGPYYYGPGFYYGRGWGWRRRW